VERLRHAVERAFLGVSLDTPEASALFDDYAYWGTTIYNDTRPAVYLLALLAALWSLYARGWLLAAPMLVHTANMLVHAGLGVIYARYIQGLDILLFAQVAIGLALVRDTPTIFRVVLRSHFHARSGGTKVDEARSIEPPKATRSRRVAGG